MMKELELFKKIHAINHRFINLLKCLTARKRGIGIAKTTQPFAAGERLEA
jgi:hypothetical protein